MPNTDRCPSSPAGESHRWRIPDQGTPGLSRCRHCQAERLFPAYTDATRWDKTAEQITSGLARGSRAGNLAAQRACAARKAAEGESPA